MQTDHDKRNSTYIQYHVQSYQKQLVDLNELLSPNELFNSIDLMLNSYLKLKKTYIHEYEQLKTYNTKIRSFLQSKNPFIVMSIPTKNIEEYIIRMQLIASSVYSWFKKLRKLKLKRKDIAHSHANNTKKVKQKKIKTTNNDNIRPSHAKKISGSFTNTPQSNSKSPSTSTSTSPPNSANNNNNNKKRKKKRKKHKKSISLQQKIDNQINDIMDVIDNIEVGVESSSNLDLEIIKEYKRIDDGDIKSDNSASFNSSSSRNIQLNSNQYNNNHIISTNIINNTNNIDNTGNTDNINDPNVNSMSLGHNLVNRNSIHSSKRSFGELFTKAFALTVQKSYQSNHQKHLSSLKVSPTQLQIAKYYHDNYFGQGEMFESPFGNRPVIYCDWTASGKPLKCIEKYIFTEMLTLYANTHTTTSITGIQTSKYRSESRSIVLESLGGNSDDDVVIFCGSGSTAAIYKLAAILMNNKFNSYRPSTTIVFISIYEHNSNIFIWKELGIKVIIIPENQNQKKGGIDVNIFEKYLKFYTSPQMKIAYNLLIGSFTAASNVSGIIQPIDEITLLLHKYNALSFWDYATAAPYLNINMTSKNNKNLSKDAVFISTHKFLGGPGTPGLLCAKRKLFQNYVPVVPGGGTVFVAYGIDDGQFEYLDNIEEREEGGTPDIIGSIRSALTFMIKDNLTTSFIEEKESEYISYFFSEISSINNIVIIGNTQCSRLPVISFLITHSQKQGGFGCTKTKYLHYNFIAALFNDLFGIQGRGGCACAGMYGLKSLNLSNDEMEHIMDQMRNHKNELARPGYFRINLHYTLNKNELEYIIKSVKYICKNGYKFLPLYNINVATGNYYHRNIDANPALLKNQLRSLLDISFDKNNGKMLWKQKHLRMKNNSLQKNFNQFFNMADNILLNLNKYLPKSLDEFKNEKLINDDSSWAWLPSELYKEVMNSVK